MHQKEYENFSDKQIRFRQALEQLCNLEINYKTALTLIFLNVILFHLGKCLFYMVLVICFCFSFCFGNVKSNENIRKFDHYLKNRRKKYAYSNGFLKLGSNLESTLEDASNIRDSSNSLYKQQFDQRSVQNYGTKPPLTGSYLIDDEIHIIIDLIMRDYIDTWYKNEISSKDDFRQTVRLTMHNAIRYVNSCIKEIDWEQFIMNIVAHNLVTKMRMLKKAKEKRNKLNQDNTMLRNEIIKAIKELSESQGPSNSPKSQQSNSNQAHHKKILINDLLTNQSFLQAAQAAATQHESNLIELFFDLEAEKEKGICHDDISFNSNEKENDFLQEISEIICYSLMAPNTFACLPLRCLLREILSNHLLKTTVNNLTDPDYINQTILYVCKDQAQLKTENFLLSIVYSESLDELKELRNKIDVEILKTRSYDKGGQNDQEIKQRLSSLQYIKRKIETCILNLFKINTQLSSNSSSKSGDSKRPQSESDIFLFNQHLACLDFVTVCTNETIQHCFIEFMGKHNVQNLISFYLNADMYRQFALNELERQDQDQDKTELKLTLKDFANGLINSYLLNASNFVASNNDQDDQPVNISNRIFYKPELIRTVERLDMMEHLNETLLDELQSKIFQLMKQKYYPEFKSYPEFHKILHKNDLLFKLTTKYVDLNENRHASVKSENVLQSFVINEDEDDDDFTSSLQQSSMSGSLLDEDSLIIIDDGTSDIVDRMSQSSIESMNYSQLEANLQKSPNSQIQRFGTEYKFKLCANISSSGVCNELKTSYAIYIIDVTKFYPGNPESNDYWQTYRRFNDFYDLHLTIKKRFPNLSSFTLPGKKFHNSLSDRFLERRKIELNGYLQTLCNADTIANNPKLMDLLLQFLENKPWDPTQTNFMRRVDSIFTPMISSVQNIQTSINTNVIGMVKGISDNLNPVVNTFSKMNNASPTTSQETGINFVNPSQVNHHTSSSNSMPNAKVQIDKRDLIAIDKTILNTDDMQSNNFPVRVGLMLIDEVFDLKEKNQWLRQSLMLIVKTYMKNFKGDSMNKKIKEQIADLVREEYLATYLKNFRKRLWPKGCIAAPKIERSKSIQEVTKVLAKTKLLTLVSDDLRHLLGNDATRRGIFDVFDLFQYKPLNKRLFYILAENLLANFFQNENQLSINTPIINTSPNVLSIKTTSPQTQYHVNLQNSPFIQIMRSHLSKSSRVKSEWKTVETFPSRRPTKKRDSNESSFSSGSLRASNHSLASVSPLVADKNGSKTELSNKTPKDEKSSSTQLLSASSMQRSRSLYTDINC